MIARRYDPRQRMGLRTRKSPRPYVRYSADAINKLALVAVSTAYRGTASTSVVVQSLHRPFNAVDIFTDARLGDVPVATRNPVHFVTIEVAHRSE